GVGGGEAGQELARLQGQTGLVDSASFSPDGKRVVTGSSNDATARVWDAQTGRELGQLRGHTGTVVSASFSPDGKRVVIGSDDGTARVQEAETGRGLALLRGHPFGVSGWCRPDGKGVAASSWDQTVRVWDADTGKLMLTLLGHTSGVYFARFSDDGIRILTAGLIGTDEAGQKAVRVIIYDSRPVNRAFL